MNSDLLKIEIVTPEKILFSKLIKSVTVPGELGSFQVLVNHAPLLSNLVIGIIKIICQDDSVEYYATSGGFIQVEKNSINLLVETIEKSDEIDYKRAEESLKRANERLKNKNSELDLERASVSLQRAVNRINLIKKHSH